MTVVAALRNPAHSGGISAPERAKRGLALATSAEEWDHPERRGE